MLFNSFTFIFIILPVILSIYLILPGRLKNSLFLLASLFLYSWAGSEQLFILIVSIFINYFIGLFLSYSNIKGLLRKVIGALGIIGNVSLLFYYKYFNFSAATLGYILNVDFHPREIILPIGISFFTFQSITYIVTSYKSPEKANKNLLEVALYIAMFPQISSGPIVRYENIIGEIKNRKVTLDKISYGVERFVIGLFKKLMIADILGEAVNNIFSGLNNGIDTPTAWLGIICYTLQIYYDFSGYSDMAIGVGSLFGFTLPENFNYPYISKSISEFWRRWHISLSTWFRDYIYIPLGGNRRGNVYFNLFVVFLTTGIWHGASWTFILWGIWHGSFIIIERLIRNKAWYTNIPSMIKWFTTMFIVIMGWMLFRASTLTEVISYFKQLFGAQESFIEFTFLYYLDLRLITVLILALIGAVPISSKIISRLNNNSIGEGIKSITVGIVFILCIILLVNSTYSPFIYFEF